MISPWKAQSFEAAVVAPKNDAKDAEVITMTTGTYWNKIFQVGTSLCGNNIVCEKMCQILGKQDGKQ